MPKPSGFCGLPDRYANYDKAAAVILPIPFDKTSTWVKGADKALQQSLRHHDIWNSTI